MKFVLKLMCKFKKNTTKHNDNIYLLYPPLLIYRNVIFPMDVYDFVIMIHFNYIYKYMFYFLICILLLLLNLEKKFEILYS